MIRSTPYKPRALLGQFWKGLKENVRAEPLTLPRLLRRSAAQPLPAGRGFFPAASHKGGWPSAAAFFFSCSSRPPPPPFAQLLPPRPARRTSPKMAAHHLLARLHRCLLPAASRWGSGHRTAPLALGAQAKVKRPRREVWGSPAGCGWGDRLTGLQQRFAFGRT